VRHPAHRRLAHDPETRNQFRMISLPTLFRAIPSTVASLLLIGAVAATAARAADPTVPTAPGLRLWPGDAPGALGKNPEDIPTITAYLPDVSNRNGASVLILPGGGYGHLAEHEGKGYAEWFAAHGVTAYVLKYRLGPKYHHPVMLEDASRALRTVRAFAKRDGLDPARVAVIGSSAGGHLAATLVTHFDAGNANSSDPIERESSRPDLGILCYPVITMGEFTHQGSKDNLLGKSPSPELVNEMSAELHVTKDTPPCFLWSTFEDRTVPVENTLMFAGALRKAGVPFSLHIFEKGPHGLGMGRPRHPAPPWIDDLVYWLKERKFIP
jgi:acetyl esterase/lipase